jgi:hypothetical protein
MLKRFSLFRKFPNLHHGDSGTRSVSYFPSQVLHVFVVQKKLLPFLFLIILLIPSAVVFASASNATRINIFLSNSDGQPLSNVQVLLDLYFYEMIASDQTELRGAYSDECTTDKQGMCTILIGKTQDLLLRGRLDLGGYGSRNVEWHGGVLDVPIRIAQEAEPHINSIVMYSGLLLLLISLVSVIVGHRGAYA